jgi:hypothetical protein
MSKAYIWQAHIGLLIEQLETVRDSLDAPHRRDQLDEAMEIYWQLLGLTTKLENIAKQWNAEVPSGV